MFLLFNTIVASLEFSKNFDTSKIQPEQTDNLEFPKSVISFYFSAYKFYLHFYNKTILFNTNIFQTLWYFLSLKNFDTQQYFLNGIFLFVT